MKFNNNIYTNVPTCALVEVYQTLAAAVKTHDWDLVNVALECVAEEIDRYTEVPAGLDIKPSGSSLIAMDCKSGIITDDQGRDYQCAAGKPISFSLSGGVCQCPDDCPHCKGGGCFPSSNGFLLESGLLYEVGVTKGEEVVTHLRKVEKSVPEGYDPRNKAEGGTS